MTTETPDGPIKHRQRVRQLCERAQSLPPAEREAFVEKAAGKDTALLDDVLSMLRTTAEGKMKVLPAAGPAGPAGLDDQHAAADADRAHVGDAVQSTATNELLQKLASAPKLEGTTTSAVRAEEKSVEALEQQGKAETNATVRGRGDDCGRNLTTTSARFLGGGAIQGHLETLESAWFLGWTAAAILCEASLRLVDAARRTREGARPRLATASHRCAVRRRVARTPPSVVRRARTQELRRPRGAQPDGRLQRASRPEHACSGRTACPRRADPVVPWRYRVARHPTTAPPPRRARPRAGHPTHGADRWTDRVLDAKTLADVFAAN